MTHLRRTLAGLTLAATLVSGAALAQQGMGQGMGGGGMATRMEAMDTDGNGSVSLQEMLTHAEDVFHAMDADGDGKVTMDEYMALRMGSQQGGNTAMQARRQEEKEARFAPMDTNGDGTLSLDEFLSGAKARFGLADENGDGELARPEWRALHF
ncbi:EF-hand domain-containing protein [Stappia sp. TSB10GB4]|uniref:EF-hand domain-containing protein n=1 Tax=Stappia sp. TSB10GB4 TaxID=2003584 RepID=UPI001644FDAD|nr:EF-hand domain-containing protein [Stappia sp. TSB10GB4]